MHFASYIFSPLAHSFTLINMKWKISIVPFLIGDHYLSLKRGWWKLDDPSEYKHYRDPSLTSAFPMLYSILFRIVNAYEVLVQLVRLKPLGMLIQSFDPVVTCELWELLTNNSIWFILSFPSRFRFCNSIIQFFYINVELLPSTHRSWVLMKYQFYTFTFEELNV